MKKIGLFLLAVSAALGWSLASSVHAHHPKHLAPCEPGFQWVEVTEIKEVCRDVCKIVPDVKKTTKWVYSTIDDPFCIHKTGHQHGHLLHGHKACGHETCQADCPSCQGPYCRKQLVKKQVVCEEPTTKCVVEKIVEKVPCTVWRKVPCATTTPVAPEVIQAPPKVTP